MLIKVKNTNISMKSDVKFLTENNLSDFNNKFNTVWPLKMVLEHQGLLPNLPNSGLQPALQLYAAAAAQLAPRARVPPWAPFLQFGIPGAFGSPFLTRPRFGPSPNGPPGLAGLTSLGQAMVGNGNGQGMGIQRTMPGPPSEDSNEDRGKL